MAIEAIDHVQIAGPPGCEAEARRFFGELLGLTELAKPGELRARGGTWFEVGAQQLHIGVEEGHRPSKKAHPAFAVERGTLDRTAFRLEDGGCPISWDESVPGVRRFYVEDPWGNRIELLETGDRP